MKSVNYYIEHRETAEHRFYVHSLGMPDEPPTIVVSFSVLSGHDASTVGLTVAETVALRDLLTAAIEASGGMA